MVSFSSASADTAGKSDTKVKATATATKPDKDGNQTVTVTIDIDRGWYIYANPVGDDDFANNRTNIAVMANGKVAATVKYPVGKSKTEVIGKETHKYQIYQDRVSIPAEVRRAAGDAGALAIIVEVNACRIGADGKTAECLEKGTIRLTVP
jgi:DsbC/DsbD-like thiol-disulfide interchange protein